MRLTDVTSVEEAAERLGVSVQAVRSLAASGRLAAVKRGGGWLLDARAVERHARQRSGSGRPLSPVMAWSVLLAASGDRDLAAVARHDHHPRRARRWLATHSLVDDAARLRGRAQPERFEAHRSELARLLARSEVMRTGISAADQAGLQGGDAAVEIYAPIGHRAAIVAEHALEPGDGAVLVRWLQDRLWPVLRDDVAPRAAVLIDLLEHDDPRARREAVRVLA